MKRRLVLSAHADDECIGCGGTIAKYCADGASVFIGVLSRESDDGVHRVRRLEAEAAWKVLGVEASEWALMRSRPFTVSSASVDVVTEWLEKFRPDIVFVPHEHEQDLDHAAVHVVLKHAMLQFGTTCPVLGYEVWTPIRHPVLFEDVSNTFETKTQAIKCFASQLESRDYLAGFTGLNRFRGVMSGIGDYVEVFSLMGL